MNTEYISPWAIKKKFTDLELAIMEGGHSLEEYNEKTSNDNNSNNAVRMQFINGLLSKQVGR